MSWCVFLGDELTAAGFRLAGAETCSPEAEALPGVFDRLCEQAQLILITAQLAEALPSGRLSQAQRADWPLVVVIPDIRDRHRPPDPAAALRRQMGLAE